MEFKFVSISRIHALPMRVGVYAFFASPTCPPKLSRRRKLRRSEGGLLYIGKAINIKERVKNHFQQPNFKDNIFIPETTKIGFVITGSEIEALLLEAKLIKKRQPKYNTVWRDGKSHNYVFITKEEFPRVFVSHQLQLTNNKKLITNNRGRSFVIRPMLSVIVGPFVDGQALKQTLRVLRRVFPYRTCKTLPKKPCLYKELNLCQAPCEISAITHNLRDRANYEQVKKFTKIYKKNITNLIKILRGQKNSVINNLKKEMRLASQKQNYERAHKIKNQIFSLENVFSHSRILKSATVEGTEFLRGTKELGSLQGRIEGYDISNIQGQQAAGGLVVFENGLPNKNEYRKFHIKIEGQPNDTAMLKEMISRRLKRKEWPVPQAILIDGGKAQLGVALQLKIKSSKYKVMALAKRNNELFIEGKKEPILLKNLPPEIANLILRIRDEAHRFAISYHKKLRSKSFLP